LRSKRDRTRDEIVVDLLSYFLRNPSATDSFDGIVRWRIMDEIVRRSVADTEGALEVLIAEGYMRQEQVPGGKTVYALRDERRDDAERLVRESQSACTET
jgi:hypothetical protein